jgi:hypothetical protein
MNIGYLVVIFFALSWFLVTLRERRGWGRGKKVHSELELAASEKRKRKMKKAREVMQPVYDRETLRNYWGKK